MVARKQRTHVVYDTNVFVSALVTRRENSPTKKLVRALGKGRKLQLLICEEVVDEYLDAFARRTYLSSAALEHWAEWFATDPRCSLVTPGPRPKLSRDPDDNIFLATARAGHAEFLVTNDHDLIDLPDEYRRTLPFAIVTPREFLDQFERV